MKIEGSEYLLFFAVLLLALLIAGNTHMMKVKRMFAPLPEIRAELEEMETEIDKMESTFQVESLKMQGIIED